MQMTAEIVEETRPSSEALMKNWLAFRQYLRLAMGTQPIAREQDHAFLQVKAVVQRNFSQLRTRLPKPLLGSAERMQELMKHALSVTHVRNLPAPDKKNIYGMWHASYIEICRLAGALKFMGDEKRFPNFEEKVEKVGANLKANMVAEAKADKKGRR